MRNVRIAIIGGAGFMGKAHSLAYDYAAGRSDLGFSLVKQTLVDVDHRAAEAAARDLGWASAESDWHDVIGREEIDVVDICTPPHTHAEIALAAIRARKSVFCEKPITNSAAEAQQMASAADAAGVTNQVGFNYRSSAAVRLARKIIEEGRIGDPLQVRIKYVMDGGFLGNPGWRRQKTSGGSGALGDIGSHIIDMAEYLVGDIARVVGSVTSYAPVSGGFHDVDDAGVFLAEFVNGALGSFSYSLRSWGQKNCIAFELDGSKGAITFDWNNRDELNVIFAEDDHEYEGFRRIILSGLHEGSWFDLGGIGSGYVEASANQIVSFLTALVKGDPAHPSFAEAARIQRVVEAVSESASARTWIDIPVGG